MTRKRKPHTPEQIVEKRRDSDTMLTFGNEEAKFLKQLDKEIQNISRSFTQKTASHSTGIIVGLICALS